MRKDKYVFIPSFSLTPDRVSAFNSVFIRDYDNERLLSVHEKPTVRNKKNTPINDNNIIKRQAHSMTLSPNAYRTLKRKITWLYHLSKSKHVKTYNGKDIYNFKIGFLTLTLPTKQMHSTSFINSEILNQFLTEIRQRTGMKNYVWRLEFQKNGNVHYHLVTDTYIDYYLALKVWNRILKGHGYIDEFANKYSKMTLSDYNNAVNKNRKIEYPVIIKRYARGKREKWQNPNTVDVKSVISKRAIANYISKYFGKDSTGNPIKNELDNDENTANLRLWFCSRSLSKLNAISNYCDAVDYDIFALVSYCKEKREILCKYAKIIFFNMYSFPPRARAYMEKLLKNYSLKQGYVPV